MLSSGPESRQCDPASGTEPWSLATVAPAALPGAPNIQSCDRTRELVLPFQLTGDRLGVRRQRVGLPVVEVELGGRPHLVLRPRRVTHVGQSYDDLVIARGLDLRLGHAQLVDAAAHDVDGALECGSRDRGRLRARQALVDQLYPTLEVEAQHRLLRLDCPRDAGDYDQRAADQPDDQEQDEAIALAISHPSVWMLEVRRPAVVSDSIGLHRWLFGVSTTSTPPSSSS